MFVELRKLLLVCPFGHRFKIADSLAFGESHMSMGVRGNKMTAYNEMLNGKVGSWEFLVSKGDLIKLDQGILRSYLYYEDWIEYPKKNRAINMFHLQSLIGKLSPDEFDEELQTIMFLKFKGPDGDYVLSDSIRAAMQAWTGMGDAKPVYVGRKYTSGGGKEIGDFSAGDGGRPMNRSDLSVSDQWRLDAFDIDNRKKVSPIPGAIPRKGMENFEDYCDAKISAFIRSLKATLNIIAVWNNGMVGTGMAEIFLADKKENVDLTTIASGALTAMLGAKNAVQVSNYVEQGTSGLDARIREGIETHGIIKPDDTSRDIAINILAGAIVSFIGHDDFGKQILPPGKSVTQSWINLATKYATNAIGKDSKMISFFASDPAYLEKKRKSKVGKRKVFIQKMFLLSFSSYMSKAISEFSEEYLLPSGARYIGFDIGVDLSDYDTIMNIDRSFLDEIDDEPVVDDYKAAFTNNDGEDKTDLIDRAYLVLALVIGYANRFATSPQSIKRAKEFAGNKLANMTNVPAKYMKVQMDNFFPIVHMPLKNKNTKYWISGTMDVFNPTVSVRVPLTGSNKYGKQITDRKDTKRLDGGRIVNPSLNYDSSKMQIGQIAPRAVMKKDILTGDQVPVRVWPAEEQGFGGQAYIGMALPFNREGSVSAVSASNAEIKVSDYSVSINIDGSIVDISFLFQRGLTRNDLVSLGRIEGLINESEAKYAKALDVLGKEFPDKRSDEYEINVSKVQEAHEVKLQELRARREEIPLRFKTPATYYSPLKNAKPGDLPFLSIQDFEQKYTAIKPKSKTTLRDFPPHRQNEAKALISKIRIKYKEYARSKEKSIVQREIEQLTLRLHLRYMEKAESTVCLTLTDPHNAYRIMNSPAILGADLDQNVKTQIEELLMNLYGGYKVLNHAEALQGRPVSVREILTMRDEDDNEWSPQEVADLNAMLHADPEMMNHAGLYYDIFEGGDGGHDDQGSYVDYVHSVFVNNPQKNSVRPEDGVSVLSDLNKVKKHTREYGMSIARPATATGSEARQAKMMANRARKAMLQYIADSASGRSTMSPSIKEEAGEDSKLIKKISKRSKILAGIILSSDIEGLMPEYLIREAEIELHYENILQNM